VLASGNGEDVYNDASSLTAIITGTSGGNFENLVVGTGTGRPTSPTPAPTQRFNLSASTVTEGAVAPTTRSRRRCRTPRKASPRSTRTRATSRFANGQTVGTLVFASGNGEDVYNDASSLTGDHHRHLGRNFENLVVRHRDGDGQRHRHQHRRNGST